MNTLDFFSLILYIIRLVLEIHNHKTNQMKTNCKLL